MKIVVYRICVVLGFLLLFSSGVLNMLGVENTGGQSMGSAVFLGLAIFIRDMIDDSKDER